MSAQDANNFMDALNGGKGDLDAWLECHNEAECRAAFRDAMASNGMTMRDEFAAKALQGWVASSPKIGREPLRGTQDHAEALAKSAYIYADAMLKARQA